jgi:glycosyltransferase involved in cell wall biosynthesis
LDFSYVQKKGLEMKVIQIIHYPIDYELWENDPPTMQWVTKNGKICAIWDGNWAQIFANAILKIDNSIKYEIWRPDSRADRIYTYTYPNGLVYKLFPSRQLDYWNGLKRDTIYFSYIMIQEIENLIEFKEKVILHINAAFRYHDKLILDRFYGRIPIIAQFYTNPLLQLESNITKNPLKLLHRLLIKRLVDSYNQKLSYIVPSTQSGMEYFEKNFGSKVFYRDNFAPVGIDFVFWEKDISKPQAREKLGIDQKELMFFVSSRLVPEKQIDLMIMEFGKVNNQEFKIYISGNGQLEYTLYLNDIVKKSGLYGQIVFIGFVPEQQLKHYYLACDYFISTSKSESGPFSTAIAALLEIPIITTKTGLVYELLSKYQAGLYLESYDHTKWHEQFQKALDGIPINICEKWIINDFFDWERIAKFHVSSYTVAMEDFYLKNRITKK